MGKWIRRALLGALAFALLAGCAAPSAGGTLKAGMSKEEAAADRQPASTQKPAAAEEAPASGRDAELLQYAAAAQGIARQDMAAVLRFLDGLYGDGGYVSYLAGQGGVRFYRSVPFGAGTLVLAMEPADGESAPELYYVENGAVAYATAGADCWSINMTRLNGRTIVFGANFAGGETSSAIATFTNGARAEQTLVKAGDGGVDEGYILVTDGAADPIGLALYAGGETVATETSAAFAYDAPADPWAGTNLSTFMRVRLCFLWPGAPQYDEVDVRVQGNEMDMYDWEFTRYYKNQLEWTASDAWRNNNATWQQLRVSGGDTVAVMNLPDDIERAYLVYVAKDDGKTADFSAIEREITLRADEVTFDAVSERTPARLVFETGDEIYVLPVIIEP